MNLFFSSGDGARQMAALAIALAILFFPRQAAAQQNHAASDATYRQIQAIRSQETHAKGQIYWNLVGQENRLWSVYTRQRANEDTVIEHNRRVDRLEEQQRRREERGHQEAERINAYNAHQREKRANPAPRPNSRIGQQGNRNQSYPVVNRPSVSNATHK